MADVELKKSPTTETEISQTFEMLNIDLEDCEAIKGFLEPLKQRDLHSYQHCERVALLTQKIGKFLGYDEKALFLAGLLHDIGKAEMPVELLKKTETWTDGDYRVIEQHVVRGYEVVRTRFDFTAEIILLHHKFQKNGYPKELPPHLHEYSEEIQALILEYARIMALADVYDALHRENCKFGEKRCLSGDEIKEKMMELNPDRVELVEELYEEGIFCA